MSSDTTVDSGSLKRRSATAAKLLETPQLIDGGGTLGEYALCYVPMHYGGPCAMRYSTGELEHWAIFPSREIAMSAAAAACRQDIGGYQYVSLYPAAGAPPDSSRYGQAIDWLFEGYDLDDPSDDHVGIGLIVRKFMRELARRVAAQPTELADIEWRDLERLLFEVFDALGYHATLTRPAKDGGYDLRLEAEGKLSAA